MSFSQKNNQIHFSLHPYGCGENMNKRQNYIFDIGCGVRDPLYRGLEKL